MLAQSVSFLRSLCNSSWSFKELICLYSKQSSAKRRTVDERPSAMLLIKIKNSMGPRTEPWGTPEVLCFWGFLGWKAAHNNSLCAVGKKRCDPFDHIWTDVVVPEFVWSLWWGTLSKALEKSRTATSAWEWWIRIDARSLEVTIGYRWSVFSWSYVGRPQGCCAGPGASWCLIPQYVLRSYNISR